MKLLKLIKSSIFLTMCVATVVACSSIDRAITVPGHATVVWISVDGNRFDYVDRSHAPLLTQLMHEGAYTRELTPAFPSITFASHTTEATGTYVDQHRIPANGFYDTVTKTKYSFPDNSSLVAAEPIWITAERQGVRTAVIDWPLSSKEVGPVKADYSSDHFDDSVSDQARTQRLIDVWQNDVNPKPLRLLIGYVDATDKAGHKYGPDAPETLAALVKDDAVLSSILAQAKTIFDARAEPQDELYFVVTTDHGMSNVKTLANVDRLIGSENVKNTHIVDSGPIANIYLSDLPEADRPARVASILAKLKEHDFVEAYAREDLPPRWRYGDPTRVGDVVAVLKKDYSWSSLRTAATMPVVTGPRGMHGYPTEEDAEMHGFAVIWRYRHKLGGIDLGKVETVQLEPTVAAILGIKPATGAVAPVIAIQ